MDVLKKRKLLTRLPKWEASCTSEKKQDWRHTQVSSEVNEMASTLGHCLDQQNYFPEGTENSPFTQWISSMLPVDPPPHRYLVERCVFSFPLGREMCPWACTQPDSASSCVWGFHPCQEHGDKLHQMERGSKSTDGLWGSSPPGCL